MLEPLLIAWLIIHFEPLQTLILKSNVVILIKALTCFKCVAFWTTLVYGIFFFQFLIYPAIINSIIAYVYSRIDNKISTNL